MRNDSAAMIEIAKAFTSIAKSLHEIALGQSTDYALRFRMEQDASIRRYEKLRKEKQQAEQQAGGTDGNH